MFGTRWAIVHRDQTFSEPLTRALEDVPRTAGSFASLRRVRVLSPHFFCAFPSGEQETVFRNRFESNVGSRPSSRESKVGKNWLNWRSES